MSIILAMPGVQENQERFWNRCIMDTGLEFYTKLAFQANGKWNDQYPADLLIEYPEAGHIALEQYKHTLPRFTNEWRPKPYEYTYLDYEPKKPDGSWVGDKLNDGLNDADVEALQQMRRGVQEATDGLPFSIYRTPPLPHNRDIDEFAVKSAHEIAEHCEWVWMDAYARIEITQATIGDNHDRLIRDFGALSKLGRRVIPWVWPSWRLDEHQALVYGAATIKSLTHVPGIDHIGVWVDCNHASVTDAQIDRFISIAPYLRKFMED